MKRILLLSDALSILSVGFIGPIYALFVEKIGGNILEAGTSYAIFMVTAGVVVLLLAVVEDRVKTQKSFIIAGYGIGVIGTVGYLFVNSSITLFLVQALLGLAMALKGPAYDGLFSRVDMKHVTLAWGEWEAMDYFTLGASAFFGSVIAQYFGFTALLWCMSGAAVLSFLISLSLLYLHERNV